MKQSTLSKYQFLISRAWHKHSFTGLKTTLHFIQYGCGLLVPYQLWEKNIIAAAAFILCTILIFRARESVEKYENELIFDDFTGNRRTRRAKWAAVFRVQRKIRGW